MRKKRLSMQINALIALGIFLILMGGLTIISRHADELITAQVRTVTPKPMVVNNIQYMNCVPLEVLHNEGGKAYVFVVSEKETVLGKETVAERIDIVINDQDDSYAALNSGFVRSQEFVLSSNKDIKSGERIHLVD